MQGKNELHLNHDTVVEAVEYWLNKVIFKDNVQVKGFSRVERYPDTVYCVEFYPEYEDGC